MLALVSITSRLWMYAFFLSLESLAVMRFFSFLISFWRFVSSAISSKQLGSAEFNFISDDLNVVLVLELVGVIVTKHGPNNFEWVLDMRWEFTVMQ